MNILAVDGSVIFSGLLKKVTADLEDANLITCSSGRLALNISENLEADILIMDINPLDIDGLELIRRVNAANRDIYILLIIDKQDYERLEEALAIGIDDYILKPLEMKELAVRVKKAVYAMKARSRRPELLSGLQEQPGSIQEEMPAAPEQFSPAGLAAAVPTPSSGIAEELKPAVAKPAAAAAVIDSDTSSFFITAPVDKPFSPQEHGRPRAQKRRRDKKVPSGGGGTGNPFALASRVVGNIIFACLLLLMASLAFFLIQSKLAGGVPSVFGHQMYVVLSGSMEPAVDTGSVALVRPVAPEEIAVGDIITFKGAGGGSVLTTHRVVAINQANGLSFVTRGDANRVNDPHPVPAANVVGRVHGRIPYLGCLFSFAQTRNGLFVLVVLPGILIILWEIRNLYLYMTDLQKNKANQQAGNYTAR